jgi:hypothetical protein
MVMAEEHSIRSQTLPFFRSGLWKVRTEGKQMETGLRVHSAHVHHMHHHHQIAEGVLMVRRS